jgi:hypothetical protein
MVFSIMAPIDLRGGSGEFAKQPCVAKATIAFAQPEQNQRCLRLKKLSKLRKPA